jgi:DNA excision repair protein ERCC-2
LNYVVAVRALCEFTAKRGDLDLRFTPSPSAQEGIAGHALVASRRGASYQPEMSLAGEYGPLQVRGRADGYDPELNRLEEVKTFRGDLARVPENHRDLHWAQARIYGWLLCRKLDLKEVRLALVYFDIASLQETVIDALFTADALHEFFDAQCECFLQWARQEMAHRSARDEALGALKFVHPAFRPGQRELAEAVFRSAAQGHSLMAQAPTGIGKTIGTVFPVLKAMPRQSIAKIFYLAAKTPGRKLALDALALVRRSSPGLPLRVLELVAKTKACEHPDKACHGDACPLARGFYDRLPDARQAAAGHAQAGGALDREGVRQLALAHGLCPYYLAQDLVRWADVVVGDYNYYFDTSAMLHSLATQNQWRVSLLVDEAHNLVERARGMYSAALDQAALGALQGLAPAALRQPLALLQRAWRDLNRAAQAQTAGESQAPGYFPLEEIPDGFAKALQQALAAITDHLAQEPARLDATLQAFYFDALHFSRMADSFGKHSLFDMTLPFPAAADSVLNIRNVVPAPFLAPRLGTAWSCALFSATLGPRDYYADLLGLAANAAWVDVQSPFSPAQLAVSVCSDISTRFRDRGGSLQPIARLIARQYHEAPGSYLVFLSSYEYMAQLAGELAARNPQITVWQQTPQMSEAARDQFLAQFSEHSEGIGFAVLGGAFAEGIDLPGKRLVGAFIATLGLPQINPVTEQIRLRMAVNFGAEKSYDYAYLYPGLQKIVQAAGRVIRTTSDQGVVMLMDDRFSRAEVRALLPAWWRVGHVRVRLPDAAMQIASV